MGFSPHLLEDALKTSDFYYDLPTELIAQHSTTQRDASRLLVYHRKEKQIEETFFSDLMAFLKKGDCLVLNNTRVIPARLIGERVAADGSIGGKIEFLLLRRIEGDRWETLVKPGKRAKVGTKFRFGPNLEATILDTVEGGTRLIEFKYVGVFEEILDEIGQMPLPPYITAKLLDKERYQTVYAKDAGSAAAPTAGLHFTDELLAEIKRAGVYVVEILLHVGLGTFRPVKAENVEEHEMHSEYYEVDEVAAQTINFAREQGGRVICVGTTSARTLETIADENGKVKAQTGWTDIFITPGYRFKAVDSLITNFHLPESTLLMLVSALCSREEMLDVYRFAVEHQYRFFSFGDAMLID